MNDKASAQISAGSDKAWGAWEWPCREEGQGLARLLCPSSGREHQDTQCVGWLPSQAEAGYRTGSFPSTDVAQGQGKDRIVWFCDFLLRVKFGFALWEVRRINLGKGKRWIQAPCAGAPQRPSSLVAAKLTSEKDPDSTARVRSNTESQNKFWRHSDFLLN